MSSLLLSLSSKPSLRKLAQLRCHTHRMFSSSSTNPYLLYCVTHYGSSWDDINVTSNIHYFDPVKEDEVIVRDKVLPMELRKGCLVGMSHGWGVFKAVCGDNSYKAIYVTDYYNPCGSISVKNIPLHPLGKPIAIQQQAITNAAMNCSSDQSNEFAVAVKCLGPMINFNRPGGKHRESGSVVFKTLFQYFDQSKVMFSKRDEKFYTPSFGGQFLVSWDSFFEEDMTGSELQELQFSNLPEFTQSEWELLDSCSKTVYLVESPSGQRFLIKWYAQNHEPGNGMAFLCRGTKRFMVFRQEEETGVMSYTEDIGDLSIFLGNNEPFCVKANPNSIYFAGDGCGVYDIATRKPCSFCPKSPSAFSLGSLLPYWIPPMSL
ncbi:PREDICTED: uncharacterized protein LOC104718779 [Camelina sativa]|uniref:Uncharacterized protein LOC104718779 n=2 Tax=Camelina sativa TaxID=90675 RepID=A0ABM0U2K3_CAMSA|nr:PREDICTED: uncharacterized protein LOC104718779 [Camelina sativa]